MRNESSLSAKYVIVPIIGTILFSHGFLRDSYDKSLLARQLMKGGVGVQSENHIPPAPANDVQQNIGVVTTREILVELRDDGFPISAIAEMMGVERKTVYSWINGSTIKSANEERILDISSLLKEDKKASYKNLYRYFNRNIAGTTLSGLLKEQRLNSSSIREVLAVLWPLAEKTEKQLGAHTSNHKTNNPILDESSEAFIA